MKKFFVLLLALCLLCGGMAMADENKTEINQGSTSKTASTTVSYTVQANESYTVTIPGSVTLSGSADNITGSITILLNAASFNVAGKRITVKLSAAANNYTGGKYTLVSDGNKLNYTLKQAGVEYKPGDTVLEWTYGDGTATSYSLNATAYPSTNLPAGNYTDTLTFAVSVTDSSSESTDAE